MEYKQLNYNCRGAYEAGVKKHPQTQMKELGYKVIGSVPQSIADCWWFTVEDIIEPLPNYLEPMKYNYDYWHNKCYEDCDFFKKSFDCNTQTRHPEYCCYGGSHCLRAE